MQEENTVLESLLTRDPREAGVHVVPMNWLTKEKLGGILQSYGDVFSSILAVKPTGWTFTSTSDTFGARSLKPQYWGKDITLIPLPYSEHSSYNELKAFVQAVPHVKIIPTVNVGSEKSRLGMDRCFKEWMREIQ